jgi:hypothetical protein
MWWHWREKKTLNYSGDISEIRGKVVPVCTKTAYKGTP